MIMISIYFTNGCGGEGLSLFIKVDTNVSEFIVSNNKVLMCEVRLWCVMFTIWCFIGEKKSVFLG